MKRMKRISALLITVAIIISSMMAVNASEYTVKKGDVLWKIARDNGTTVEAIVEANDIDKANMIYEGNILNMPTKSDVVARKEVTAVKNWEANGFTQPESVLYVPGHEWIYSSNANMDGLGYISRIAKDGTVDDYKFVDGLPLTLGMAYYQDQIFVASLNSVKVIDINTGAVVKELIAADGGMLNDITISPDGDLYVTDFQTRRIYKSNGDKLVTWFESEDFIMLNGIFFDYGSLLVSNMNMEDMTGSILRIDLATKEMTTIKSTANIGAIDGISKLGNRYIASNATTMELISFTDETVEVLGKFEGGMADISVNQTTGEVYLPYLETGKVESYTFK